MNGLAPLFRRAIAGAWTRRWIFAVPTATLLLPAALYVVHLPDTYRATATVSVRQVNTERVGGALPTTQEWRAEQILSTARDRVLQAPNVAAMVPVLWPEKDPADPRTIDAGRSRALYDQSGDTRFSISIEDPAPARAAEAVNVLVEAFLAGERKEKLRVVEGHRDFREGKAREARKKYDDAVARMEEFRRTHADTMPDQKDAVTAEVHRIEAEARERESDAQRARLLVPEADKMLRSSLPAGGVEAARTAMSADEQLAQLKLASANSALDQAKKSLGELRLRYTEKHDAVKAAALQVSTLETEVTRAKEALDVARKHGEADTSARRRTDNEGLMQYLRQWRESLLEEEKRARAAADELRARSEELSKRLAKMPGTADELLGLKPQLEDAYQTHLRADEAARNAQWAADFYRDGEPAETIGFAIDSHAVPPSAPSGPARVRWLATAAAIGLLLGYGMHVLRRRYVDQDLVAAPGDVADLVPGALVVWVPMIAERAARRLVRPADVACAAWVLLCTAGIVLALGAHGGLFAAPTWFRPWLGNAS